MKRAFAACSRSPSGPAFALLLCCLAAGVPVAAQAQRAAQGRGLWIGPVPACAGTVAGVTIGADESGAQLNVNMTFLPAWREALGRETSRLVGRPMIMRLDGRTISSPIVREPITGGMIALAGFTRRQAESIRAAALRACPRGVR
jgi:preprotein translocase subunit SecD